MRMRFISRSIVTILIAALMNTAIAVEANDPFEPINKIVFYFNQITFGLYIKPAARAYDVLLPFPVKAAVHNFIINMRTTRYFVNDVLQGEFLMAANDAARFVLNSTLGIFGLFDVATPIGLKFYSENLGNTLYKWGWKDSNYLVIPLVGPSTLRDGVGLLGDFFLTPPTYFQPKWRDNYYIMVLIEEHHDSQDIEDLVAIAGVNDYDLIRASYMQHRSFELSGGVVPEADQNGNDLLGEPPA